MDNYEPISCDFHDILEDAAVRRLRIEVAYHDEQNRQQVTVGKIKDITVEGQEEFLIMQDDLRIRLDQIIRVDQNEMAEFETR